MDERGISDLRILAAEDIGSLAPSSLFDLTGKVAIVTGSSGGLGTWFSAGLAAAGAHVLMTDHPRAPLDQAVQTVLSGGGVASGFPIDLLDVEATDAIVESAIRQYGPPDILVNNAGVNRREPIFDVSRESWDLISAIDLRIPYELSRATAKIMAKHSGGSIIQIGSLNNAIGLEGVSVYGSHKAALCQLAKVMAVEWAQYSIRVNAICPGFMLTPLSKPLWDDPDRSRWILERSLLKRPGYPEELVGCLLLLASRAGSFITGQTFYIEGGWLAGTPWSNASVSRLGAIGASGSEQ